MSFLIKQLNRAQNRTSLHSLFDIQDFSFHIFPWSSSVKMMVCSEAAHKVFFPPTSLSLHYEFQPCRYPVPSTFFGPIGDRMRNVPSTESPVHSPQSSLTPVKGSQMPARRHGTSAPAPANSCLKPSEECWGLGSVSRKMVTGRRENTILVSKQQ